MSKPIVDFLVIGAQKCGTTWISHLLAQHPEIHIPRRKELHYFNHRGHLAKGLDWYRAQFTPHPGERFTAEATPNYFWNHTLPGDRHGIVQCSEIAPQVRAINPEARLVLALRDPVERAVSAYYHYIAIGLIDPRLPFDEALDWYGARSMGLYARHYRHWLEHFDREQILTLIFERDICRAANRPDTVERIFSHLGVPHPETINCHKPQNIRAPYLSLQAARYVSPTGWAGKKIRFLAEALVPKAIDRLFKPLVTDADKARLRDYYRPHNSEMSDLLDIELEQYWS